MYQLAIYNYKIIEMWIFIFIFHFYVINPDYILFIVKYSCFLLQHKFPTEQLLVCVCVCVCVSLS